MHSKTALAALLAPAAVSGQLNDLAVRAGLKYFGTALREGAINSDTSYAAILGNKAEFGQLVPENGQKWEATEPSRGQFTYTQGDITANTAKKNGQGMRCHTQVRDGSWTKDTLKAVMATHMNNVMGHYKGQCYAWDVVNEAVADDGTWRPNVFLSTFSTDYLPLSFNLAKAADPDVKLYYNDYNLEYNGAKTDRAVELVKIVQAAGAPIDGVGFQGHLIVGSTPSRSNLAAALRRFTALGVEVAYTELDIRHSSLPASSAALVTQGNDFANVVGSCLDVAGCIGVTVWSFTDKYSWIPETFPGQGDALLYDKNFGKKPAWTSVSSVLAAKATNSPASSSSSPASSSSSAGPGTTLITSTRTTTTPPSTTSSASGALQTQWGQCGGNGWTGPTHLRFQSTESRSTSSSSSPSAAAMAAGAPTKVSDRIKHDHRELEEYYNNIKKATRDEDKAQWQNQFVWELARHSLAEEIVVYPAMEKHLPDGIKMAEKDRSEHQQVKEKLYEFQSMQPSDPNFIPAIDSLWENLAQHIKEEERDDLPALEKAIGAQDSEAMAASFARTKHFVPTRSHPSAPDRPPYETVVGMLSMPMDKLMDMFRKFPEGK
ncbi:endo-1,4-beta-xylanase-like protein [Chaetomium strumarium]|uniref:Beta-xylanase n=1 Tax=Chaetomium strumarium TaxID=1170767 RepID=A0AAJ0LZ19_9PEZI|nr:endo-1,4-beta-xylanase-like protein [Chaetomium strumarium]